MPPRRDLATLVENGLQKALIAQAPLARAHVERLRRSRPGDSPAEIVAALERHYLTGVATMGAASGGVAALPAVGQTVGLALIVAEVPIFLDATVLLALAIAEVHGLDVHDIERRRTLVLGVILGQTGAGFIEKIAGRVGPDWANGVVNSVPMSVIRTSNKLMGKKFMTKYGTKQGVLLLGRMVPFGVGAVIGGVGNTALGRASIRSARKVLGPPPALWPLRTAEGHGFPRPSCVPGAPPPGLEPGTVRLTVRLESVTISCSEMDALVSGLPASAHNHAAFWSSHARRASGDVSPDWLHGYAFDHRVIPSTLDWVDCHDCRNTGTRRRT